ncbi:MAG TPA: hypothetical protein PLH64_07390 [Anaerolineaceae bacterium]|nr:hypothetical protein [Anaerolineaceae bacterium]
MKKEGVRSTLLPLLVIPIGGLLALGICYLIFLLINNLGESLLFSTNPTAMPVFIIRRVYALVLLVVYLVLFRTKISDLLKATILVGPLGFFLTTAILTYYEKPMLAIVAILVIAAVSTFLLYRMKKPWFYYYAIAITVVVSVALAWPKA